MRRARGGRSDERDGRAIERGRGDRPGGVACGVRLGTGYPGTPSTEILETFDRLGGRAQWSPNEKVALEVALGAAFAGARALVTMKHVGLNVAADPLFTAAYTDLVGGLVVISADDPGMASSQNEQDNRHYARAAGLPMLEPGDSQQAYDFARLAFTLSERWHIPVLLRVTTRVCHAKTIVRARAPDPARPAPAFARDLPARVMIPAYAKPAHRRLRAKLAEIAAWNDAEGPNRILEPESDRRAAPGRARHRRQRHRRRARPRGRPRGPPPGLRPHLPAAAGDPAHLRRQRRASGRARRRRPRPAGGPARRRHPREGKPETYRFGELDVARVRRILAGDTSPEPVPPKGKPPELCPGCSHRTVFETLRDLGCIVAGDIGCYTLGVLPPFSAMDTCVCMGASIGVGLGLRHVLPEDQARRVVSVIGDSTFVHSGLTGLADMVYNPPPTGHVVPDPG